MTSDAQNTAKQIKLISKANIEQSSSAAALLASVSRDSSDHRPQLPPA